MKHILKTAVILSAILGSACTDMYSTIQDWLDEGEDTHASKIYPIAALPGYKRILVTGEMTYGMDIKECVITWQPGDGEAKIPIDRQQPEETFSYYIDDLAEGTYEIEVTTYDDKGRSSIPVRLNAKSYGDVYMGTLRARDVAKTEQIGNPLRVTFTPVLQDSELSILHYENSAGEMVSLEITKATKLIVLGDWKSEGKYYMETFYLPGGVEAADEFKMTAPEGRFVEYEPLVPKSKFAEVKLPGDVSLEEWGGHLTKAWDNVVNNDNYAHSYEPFFTDYASFTFDMGTSVMLASYKLNGITTDARLYNEGTMKKWEVWGRSDAPTEENKWDESDSWEGWTKLMDCEAVKPSGSPVGTNTEEDKAYAAAGEMFNFPADVPEVRYIRFKVTDTWAGSRFIVFTELTFWMPEN